MLCFLTIYHLSGCFSFVSLAFIYSGSNNKRESPTKNSQTSGNGCPLASGKILVRPSVPHIYNSGSDGRTRIRQENRHFEAGTNTGSLKCVVIMRIGGLHLYIWCNPPILEIRLQTSSICGASLVSSYHARALKTLCVHVQSCILLYI